MAKFKTMIITNYQFVLKMLFGFILETAYEKSICLLPSSIRPIIVQIQRLKVRRSV